MKTIKQLRELIADRQDDEKIFVCFFDKSDADEFAEEMMEEEKLTDEEWSHIVNKMNDDDGVWREIIESWNWYLEKTISERKKGNDDSK